MNIYQVEYGKTRQAFQMTFGHCDHFIYVLCLNRVRVRWQGRPIIAENGCQIFLYPGQFITLFSDDEVFLFNRLEFLPEVIEQQLLEQLQLPEAFTTPAHSSELSVYIKSIYDFYFSADKYRLQKATLQGMLLLYSIASGDTDGDWLFADTTVDNTKSYEIVFDVDFCAIATATADTWADDVFLMLTNSDESHKILFELQTMRSASGAYHLGLSAHSCLGGSWAERLFKTSAPISELPNHLNVGITYNAQHRLYCCRVSDRKTKKVLCSYQIPSDRLSDELVQNKALIMKAYRNALGIAIFNVQLTYTQDKVLLNVTFVGETDRLSSKDLLNRKMRRLRTMISDAPESDWTIQKASAFVNLSDSRFFYLYKQYFGLTFMNDVIRARIKRGCALLSTTDHSVAEIAQALGYDNVSLFHRQFKHWMGVSPGKYRQTNSAVL